jgi:hypothetical protein
MRYVIAAILLIAAFVVWRILSVARGARLRDERILKELQPLAGQLSRKEAPGPDAVRALAAKPHLRTVLYRLLEGAGFPDLFPAELKTRRHHAESLLAYWMMHPNELQDPPESLDLEDTVVKTIGTREAEFFVFRYRMPPGHWAGTEWLLGVAGPFFKEDQPYSDVVASGFSLASDRHGHIEPGVIVHRFIQMFEKRGGWPAA